MIKAITMWMTKWEKGQWTVLSYLQTIKLFLN